MAFFCHSAFGQDRTDKLKHHNICKVPFSINTILL